MFDFQNHPILKGFDKILKTHFCLRSCRERAQVYWILQLFQCCTMSRATPIVYDVPDSAGICLSL